jgi:hypothetical protein
MSLHPLKFRPQQWKLKIPPPLVAKKTLSSCSRALLYRPSYLQPHSVLLHPPLLCLRLELHLLILLGVLLLFY